MRGNIQHWCENLSAKLYKSGLCAVAFGMSYLKGALSSYSVFFMSIFLRSKMAARRPEAAAPANELQAWGTLFCSSSWELRNRSTSEYQSPAKVIPLSHKVDVGL